MLFIAAFIWQARTGRYGNGLIDVKEKLKILFFDNAGRNQTFMPSHVMRRNSTNTASKTAIIRKYHLRDDNYVMKNVCQNKHKTKTANEQENVLKKRIVHRSKKKACFELGRIMQ